MKKLLLILFFMLYVSLFSYEKANAQCSICAKTTQQMGEKPAKGFNSGIIYLMLTPFAIAGLVGYRWWKNNKI
jgi:protein involved in temperature-dependent protein secretion